MGYMSQLDAVLQDEPDRRFVSTITAFGYAVYDRDAEQLVGRDTVTHDSVVVTSGRYFPTAESAQRFADQLEVTVP